MNSNMSTTMSVDLKKYRIRIHKATIQQLGDPKYIQLLVNPKTMEVAIRSVDKTFTGDQAHKIDIHRMKSDNSYEIYSRTFTTKLCEIIGGLEANYSYRFFGNILPAQKATVFSLKNIQRIDTSENFDND